MTGAASSAVNAVGNPVVGPSQRYAEKLLLLSQGSVRRHFDPYVDIDWDSPDFAPQAHPLRWILPASADTLGRHPWYQALPQDQQIEVGRYRQANIAKVGLQFESILVSGMVQYTFGLRNGSAEFRYCTHEMAEELNHILMFQELVNRVGADVRGMGRWVRRTRYLVVPVAIWFPCLFFVTVLAGEEPIDHVQKQVLRSGEQLHPIMLAIMGIHVAEESRHISFAHEFLEYHVPRISAVSRFALSLATPLVMWMLGRSIVRPPKAFFEKFGVPAAVRRELFFRSPEARKAFSDYFVDVRALAQRVGLMNPVARQVWKLLHMDGPGSRYRSEPVRSAA